MKGSSESGPVFGNRVNVRLARRSKGRLPKQDQFPEMPRGSGKFSCRKTKNYSSQSADKLMQRPILGPLGMTRTSLLPKKSFDLDFAI
jgi:hypothetical protein